MQVRMEIAVGDLVIADPSELHDASASIRVVYGANYLRVKSSGLTPSEIHDALKDFLHLSPKVKAYIDGRLVEDEAPCRVRTGQTIEFMAD